MEKLEVPKEMGETEDSSKVTKVLMDDDELLVLWEILGNARVMKGLKVHAGLMDKIEKFIVQPGIGMRQTVFESGVLELTDAEKDILHEHGQNPSIIGWRSRPWVKLKEKLEALTIL